MSPPIPRFFYSDAYRLEWGEHVFPIEKYALILERILRDGIASVDWFAKPEPATREELLRVHAAGYLARLEAITATPELGIYEFEAPCTRGVLDAFYAMAGGQVGDRGVIASDGSAAEVIDTTSPLPGLHVHQVRVTHGGFERGMVVRAEVDGERRAGAMRHHTGTHLLHAALRETLGPHVKQAGSLVAPDRLRFDFSHYAPVGPRELRHIENRVNAEILRDRRVASKVMGREEALAYGALAFFGDKYGERVRVVEVPGFSKEFCGGTHVGQTGEIGLFLLTAEQGISAGTRRVEALAGEAAIERAQGDQGILEELEQAARVDRRELVDEYARLRDQLKARERDLQILRMKLATAAGPSPGEDLSEVGGILVWTPRFEGLDRKAHAAVVDDFRNRHKERRFALVSASIADDGVSVIAAVSPSLAGSVKAPDLMKQLGLRGGGRPDFAQGGGLAAADVDAMRRKAAEVLRGLLEAVPHG